MKSPLFTIGRRLVRRQISTPLCRPNLSWSLMQAIHKAITFTRLSEPSWWRVLFLLLPRSCECLSAEQAIPLSLIRPPHPLPSVRRHKHPSYYTNTYELEDFEQEHCARLRAANLSLLYVTRLKGVVFQKLYTRKVKS